jgi:RNA recognition motif-containing protein
MQERKTVKPPKRPSRDLAARRSARTATPARKPNTRIVVTEGRKDTRMVYLSNLSYRRDRVGIKMLFKAVGEVQNVKIIVDNETEQSKGMAFVEMATPAQASEAIRALNGLSVDGRILKAAAAIPQKRYEAVSEAFPKTEERRVRRDPGAEEKVAAVKAKRRRRDGLATLNAYLEKKGRGAQ